MPPSSTVSSAAAPSGPGTSTGPGFDGENALLLASMSLAALILASMRGAPLVLRRTAFLTLLERPG
jgi:hypothetical protein